MCNLAVGVMSLNSTKFGFNLRGKCMEVPVFGVVGQQLVYQLDASWRSMRNQARNACTILWRELEVRVLWSPAHCNWSLLGISSQIHLLKVPIWEWVTFEATSKHITYLFNLSRNSWGGVPKILCIFCIWSISLFPAIHVHLQVTLLTNSFKLPDTLCNSFTHILDNCHIYNIVHYSEMCMLL